jgi:glycosyltransferase involved in cell wall biosynthesis
MLTFAIVIPNLNQSHFLPTALESMKCQSAPINLALMDGGSTDNFNEVVLKYSDIISFLRSAPDGGQAAAIKEGKRKVGGDIVAWLNADDYYFPDVLIKVARCFEKDPELDVVYGDAIHVTSEEFFLSYFPPIQDFDAKELTKNCFICQPACFVRRSAYERVGGLNPNLNYTMDWDLWCKLSASGAKFRYLPIPLAAVRYYQGTKTLSGDKERFREICRIEKKYGARRLRISFLGAYYHGLTFKMKKNFGENIFFILFDLLRKIKPKIDKILGKQKTRDDLIYGFHRWEPIVEGSCVINIPWYDKRVWYRLRLKIEPNYGLNRIVLNGKRCEKIFHEDGYLVTEVPEIDDTYRQIGIERVDGQQWKLLEFTCDLK